MRAVRLRGGRWRIELASRWGAGPGRRGDRLHAAWGGHPSLSPLKFPIRRWRSGASGPAQVTIEVRKSDASGGDGVRATVFLDGAMVWQKMIDGTDGVGVIETVDVDLHVGSVVDFMLDPLDDQGRDTTEHGMVVRSR